MDDRCNPRQTWDVTLIQAAMDGTLWPGQELPAFEHHETHDPPDGAGMVVMVNGGFHARLYHRVNRALERLEWAVIMVVSDEGSRYPTEPMVRPQRSTVWWMTPRPNMVYPDGCRFLGEGWPPHTRRHAAAVGNPIRDYDVAFAGQVNHQRRQDAVDAMKALEGRVTCVLGTDRFAGGMPHAEYIATLSRSKVVLAPAGPTTPDSFRAYEALECGAVPILDGTAPGYPSGEYWPLVAPGAPMPVIEEWADLDKTLAYALDDWERLAADCQAWWQAHKRWVVTTLADDLAWAMP